MKILIFLIISCTLFNTNTHASDSYAINYYSDGKLQNGKSIIESNSKIRKLFLSRKRFFGTDELIQVLNSANEYLMESFEGSKTLQLGDLSNLSGGKAKEHASHQNGLDVDIVYLSHNNFLQNQDAPFWEEEFVENEKMTENFDTQANFDFFTHLILNYPVQRIFIDKAVKRHLCNYAIENQLINDPKILVVLNRLRTEALHTNHFHVRLYCPANDLDCRAQSEPPVETGCEALDQVVLPFLEPSIPSC